MSKFASFPTIFSVLEDKFLAESGFTFESRKNRRTLPVWAPRDHKFCEIAERAGDILSFEDRPDILSLTYGGRDVFYVVDFRVTTARSTILVGLSLFGQPGHVSEACVHELAKADCARRGKKFVHVSDTDLVRLSGLPHTDAA